MWGYPDTWLEGDHADRGRRPHPRRRAHARPHARATTSSPTAPPGCSSPATTCCPRSRRRSASSRCPAPQPLRRLHGLADQGARAARPDRCCPPTARSRRPRTPGSTSCSPTTSTGSTLCLRRARPAAARTAYDVAGELPWTRHERRLRRPRRLQRRAGRAWRPRPTSSCWSRAARRPARTPTAWSRSRSPGLRPGGTVARARTGTSGPPTHRQVRDAVLEELRAVDLEAERRRTSPASGDWASSTTSRSGQTWQARPRISRSASPRPRAGGREQRPGRSATSSPSSSTRAQPSSAPSPSCSSTCRVPGSGSRPSRSG